MGHPEPTAWKRLEGVIADDIREILRAGDTPKGSVAPLALSDEMTTYLLDQVAGMPWVDHLTLIAAVFTAQGMTRNTIFTTLSTLHPRFKTFVQTLDNDRKDAWNAESTALSYLKGDILPDDPPSMRRMFWARFKSSAYRVRNWLETLPDDKQRRYRRYTLPLIKLSNPNALMSHYTQLRPQHIEGAEAQIVVENFGAIRAAANARFHRLLHVRQAYDAAVQAAQTGSMMLPMVFSYEEGADNEWAIPAEERLHFRLWDLRSFVLAHKHGYSESTIHNAVKYRQFYSKDNQQFFIEFVRAESLVENVSPTGLWFEELLRRDVIGQNAFWGARAVMEAKQEWLRFMGYRKEEAAPHIIPFSVNVAGLFAWPSDGVSPQFMAKAKHLAEGVLIPLQSLLAGAMFGLVALDLCTSAGIGLDELRCVRIDQEGLLRVAHTSQPGAMSRARYILRVHDRENPDVRPADYFVGRETRRLLATLVEMLSEHYQLSEPALPLVPFDFVRPDDTDAAAYLFQYSQAHMTTRAIMACLRFLVHGLTFTATDDRLMTLKPDIFEQVMTRPSQIEQPPVDILGEWLKESPAQPSAPPDEPTSPPISDFDDEFLYQSARHITIEKAVAVSSAQVRQAFQELQRQAGLWCEVLGGDCIPRGACDSVFECIGCSQKILDPARRYQVERYLERASDELAFAIQEGLSPLAQRLAQLIQACEVDLQRMDQIETYQRIAQRSVTITIATEDTVSSPPR